MRPQKSAAVICEPELGRVAPERRSEYCDWTTSEAKISLLSRQSLILTRTSQLQGGFH